MIFTVNSIPTDWKDANLNWRSCNDFTDNTTNFESLDQPHPGVRYVIIGGEEGVKSSP
jgi:hypothetical protein